jgi:hypothetical protein
MASLGAHMSPADLADMFAYANMTETGALSFKEFVLCLAMGAVLQLFPLMRAYEEVDVASAARDSSATGTGTASHPPAPARRCGWTARTACR